MKKGYYSPAIYKKIPTTHLIILGIYSLLNRREKCTFEKLVEECFTLFPKIFSFSRHPEWPDSLKFDRPLRTLREKGLIMGSPRSTFTLTKFGKVVAKDTAKALKISLSKKSTFKKIGRDAEINWISSLKETKSFQRFLKEKNQLLITEMELRNLFRCTMETPKRILKQNVVYSINLAREFKENKLLEFLELCYRKLISKNA